MTKIKDICKNLAGVHLKDKNQEIYISKTGICGVILKWSLENHW